MDREICSYCGRKGVLIYPVRYAVACPAGAAEVPGLSGNFGIDDSVTMIAPAKYSLRELRPGYLYTYDEKRSVLKAYLVMRNGALWNFPTEFPSPQRPVKPVPCLDPVDLALSTCVDITHSDADPATHFWIGWSNSEWTSNLICRIGDRGWRKKHMQRIDVPAMVAGQARHTGEFVANNQSVAHFATESKGMEKAFAFSNVPPTARRREESGGIEKVMAATAHGKGYIVAVNDPVGIANDLSELTLATVHSGFDEAIYRGKITSGLIRSVESAIRLREGRNAELDEGVDQVAKQNAEVARATALSKVWDVAKAGGRENYRRQKAADVQKYGAEKQGRVLAAQDRAWAQCSSMADGQPILDTVRLAAFPQLYEAAVSAFEPTLQKLASAHFGWIASAQLANWMDGVHDDKDLRSGFAYRESLAQCIGNGGATRVCEEHLQAWLSTPDANETRNLFCRALLFNNAEIIAAAAPALKGSDVKAKHILTIYKGALARLKAGDEAKLIDRLALTTSNLLVNAIKQSANAGMRNLVLLSLSLLGRSVISPSNLSAADLRNWVIAQAKANVRQLDLPRAEWKTTAYKAAKTVVPKLPADPIICAYELDIAQLERDGRITKGAINAVRIPGFDITKEWLGSPTSFDFNLGVASTIIQLAALAFVAQDYSKADRFDKPVETVKLLIAVANVTSAAMETVGATIDKMPAHPLSVYLNKHWSGAGSNAKRVISIAKKIGLIAGLATACIDIYKAYKAIQENDPLLAGAHFAAAAFGAGVALASYIFGAAVFWPALVMAFFVGFLVALLRPDACKKWLTRCHFARSQEGTYLSLAEELQAFNTCMEG